MSEIVAEKLIDIESVQFSFDNHFTLTSGLKSPVYVDCRKIISFIPERDFIMNKAISYFQKNNLEFDLVAGGETAGIPYAAIISERIKKPMLYVRKKSKHALIWLNTETIEIDSAPSFYAVASTGNLKEIINNTENLKHKISIREVIRSIGNPATIKNPTDFTEGLIRIRNQNNLYHCNSSF